MTALLLTVLLLALFALLLVAFAQPLYRCGVFYRYADTISAQVQAVGVSLQIGSLLMGWAPAAWFNQRSICKAKPTRIVLFAPISCGGRRVIFQAIVLGHGLSFMTRGSRGASSYSWPGHGIRFI